MEPGMAADSGYLEIIKMILDLGPIGVVLILGYFAKQQLDKTTSQYQTQISLILSQYREDMLEQRKMYENNVELVKQYRLLADDLKDIIIMNTTAMTKLVEKIDKEVCR